MDRIPPSQKIGKKLDELLSQGLKGEGDVTSSIVRLGIERLVQELLEQEVTDYLEREHYQRRRPEQEHRGYRNGYEPGRIRTAEGEVVVQVPQVRDTPETYRSELMTFLRGNSDAPSASSGWPSRCTPEACRPEISKMPWWTPPETGC